MQIQRRNYSNSESSKKSMIPNSIIFFVLFTLHYKVLLITNKLFNHGKEKSF
jgi:uncharacterized membrane protein YadS